jgi:carbonic anhydrase
MKLATGVAATLVMSVVLGAAGADAPPPSRSALGMLKAGNDRFARNLSQPVPLSVNRREELSKGQHPIAMVLSCADSRVPPEHVFNVGLGDLFVIRTAGEVIDRSILATMEYGAEHLQVPLLVVMGHESCGAVQAAADDKGGPRSVNMDYLLKAIQAAKTQTQTPREREDIRNLILANVEQVINETLSKSPVLRRTVDSGRLQVVGAYYELVSGRVAFSEPIGTGREPAAVKH